MVERDAAVMYGNLGSGKQVFDRLIWERENIWTGKVNECEQGFTPRDFAAMWEYVQRTNPTLKLEDREWLQRLAGPAAFTAQELEP